MTDLGSPASAPRAALPAGDGHGGAQSGNASAPQASHAAHGQPALIALDWGTTALRAYLFDAAGQLLETRASTAGIMNLPRAAHEGGFDVAFDAVCGGWLDRVADVPVIAAGMVGSAQGWKEAPYVETPASADAIVHGIVRVQTARGATLHIVPG
ncbi:MAG TPA: 2-dehydro-3-deoxygalactonokinase, partial [Paraburkholderia sp.]